MTTSRDAVIEALGRDGEGGVSGAKKRGGWQVNRLLGRARASKRPLSTGKKEKWGIL